MNLSALRNASDNEVRESLLKIKGVGAKVAECTLLFGFGRVDAFPIDVWVRRVVGELYPNGLPECMDGVRGIAQQYLFHWRRHLEEDEKKNAADILSAEEIKNISQKSEKIISPSLTRWIQRTLY